MAIRFSVDFAQPSPWTFTMPPVRAFLGRWLADCAVIVDPFCGRSVVATLRNDLADGGVDAAEYCRSLAAEWAGRADAVLFDPPYSPRQIKECYAHVGLPTTKAAMQSGRLYRQVREGLSVLLKPGGVALSFGWQSSGFGREWATHENMLLRHGGAHNDTICVAQTKSLQGNLV